MVVNETILMELASQFPELEQNLIGLINILKILGGVLGVYILLWLINFVYSIKRTVLIKKMIERLEVIEAKLDKLSKRKNKSD